MTDHQSAPESSSTASGDSTGAAPARAASGLPKPDVKPPRESRFSWIWLVPLVAALVGVSLLVQDWLRTGPTVTISFESADGLEVGQTKVRYKDVIIGQVTDIRVAPDRTKVLVDAQLNREGSSYVAQEGTRFWVVRPRLGISGVSGLGTLLSGAYIGVDAVSAKPKGEPQGEPVYEFVGLEKPPEIASGRPGTRFTLLASDLGSLEIGSPVYFHRIEVGQVVGYDLDKNGKGVAIQVFVDKPNDKFVTQNTRFWNASGINVSLSADGFNVQTGSIVSVLAGGIAFAAPDESQAEPAGADHVFALADTQVNAMADPDGAPLSIELHFKQSVRGLKVGAPIEFRGLDLGKVVDIDLEFDAEDKSFFALVKGELYPLRFGAAYQSMVKRDPSAEQPGQALLEVMVKRGMRAQMRAANLLTGQQYVALEFYPNAEPVTTARNATPMVLPTIAGDFDRLQQQLSSIVAKIDTIPFEGIGNDLRTSLKSVTKLVEGLDGKVAPQLGSMLKAARSSLGRIDTLLAPNSSMNDNIDRSLREISAAAKSLRALADYLQTHPTALLRGPARDPMPVSP